MQKSHGTSQCARVVASRMKIINTRIFLRGNICPMAKAKVPPNFGSGLCWPPWFPASMAPLKLYCWNLLPEAMAATALFGDPQIRYYSLGLY